MTISPRILLNKYSYKLLKPILFTQDPEDMHVLFIKIGSILGNLPPTRLILKLLFSYNNPALSQNIRNIQFKNPCGLAAGFDKDARIIKAIEAIGFGFTEVGSITALPCKGNPGKRLDRILDKQSIWVNLGLNNQGAKKVKKRIQKTKSKIPIGVSIAKTNCKETSNDEIGLNDYLTSLDLLKNQGDFIVLNISCPNAYGGQPFSKPSLYNNLIKEAAKRKIKKPILVKLSPDLSDQNLNTILKISEKYNVSGFICSNLSKKHNRKSGGMSGKLVQKKADDLLSKVYTKTRPWKTKPILIGVGGISSAQDAYKKIKLGANLVQLITGMIYHGPGLISEINHNLVKLLKKDGYSNISEAIGKAHKE